jgi:hypothetical protein
MNINKIEEFEDKTGLTYDPEGPDIDECEYCGEPIQYITDHDCPGMRQASAEDIHNEQCYR